MKRRQQRSRSLLRTEAALSALECATLVGVTGAGAGGALIAFSDCTETAFSIVGEVKYVKLGAVELN